MDPLLTADDVARILNVKVSTVYDGVYRGLIPAVRIWKGTRRSLIRFRATDIDTLIRERTVPGPKATPGSHR